MAVFSVAVGHLQSPLLFFGEILPFIGERAAVAGDALLGDIDEGDREAGLLVVSFARVHVVQEVRRPIFRL